MKCLWLLVTVTSLTAVVTEADGAVHPSKYARGAAPLENMFARREVQLGSRRHGHRFGHDGHVKKSHKMPLLGFGDFKLYKRMKKLRQSTRELKKLQV